MLISGHRSSIIDRESLLGPMWSVSLNSDALNRSSSDVLTALRKINTGYDFRIRIVIQIEAARHTVNSKSKTADPATHARPGNVHEPERWAPTGTGTRSQKERASISGSTRKRRSAIRPNTSESTQRIGSTPRIKTVEQTTGRQPNLSRQ